MKRLLASLAVCSALACQAAEPDTAEVAPAALQLPPGRCPTKPVPAMVATSMNGSFRFIAHFLLKADGRIENIRVDGRGPKGLSQNIHAAIAAYRCLPAEADQEIVSTFDFKVG